MIFPESLGPKFTEFIESLPKPNPDLNDKSTILPELQNLVEKAIDSRVKGKVAIALSGGVDSVTLTYLTQKLGKDFKCFSVGVKDSPDLIAARKVAEHFDWPITVKELSDEELESTFKEVLEVVPNPDIVKLGVGSVVLEVCKLAKQEGFDIIMGGLGSEEIYAGYERHDKAESLHDECWNGMLGLWDRDLSRDGPIAEKIGVELIAPLLDEEVIKYSMRINPDYKIVDGVKKMIFREMAIKAGIPEEFSLRKKKAAQYGSAIDKAISRIAKKHGFQYKKELMESLLH